MTGLPRDAEVVVVGGGAAALLLDSTGRSGIANSVVLTLAAPSYAPAGRHLIATTAPAEAGLGEGEIRERAARLYGQPAGDWEHIATVRADPGLVTAPPPQHRLRKPVRLSPTLFVAGDHRDTPSVQGALVSGRRAARALLRELGVARADAGTYPGGRGSHLAMTRSTGWPASRGATAMSSCGGTRTSGSRSSPPW